MRVQRVVMPESERVSWTLLGDDLVPVAPAERFLAYLSSTERSPNTVKAYAHDLKDWLTFVGAHGLDWRAVTVEDVARFTAWLRLPPSARAGLVSVLPSVAAHCTESSVNRKLASVGSFYDFHARHGVEVAALLRRVAPAGHRALATAYRPFLDHVSSRQPRTSPVVRLKAVRPMPRVLEARQTQAILDACERLRDRLLFGLLLDTGVRIGEALGMRHDDVGIAERQVVVAPRDNDNGARVKSGRSRTVPASADLMRLYVDYLNGEYGALDSDYVFVNLWAEPRGRPMTYAGAYDLVLRLRRRTGIAFEPHQFRHTYATWLLRRGAGMESVKELLGHASVTTTIDTYGHLSVEDARRVLTDAGWFTERQVRL
ncbi:integrase [Micromonospora radicis]|uniref:Integrase n=2 Tax=Micromonospora radicis TaxID=1894971 RepID=A0A418MMK3_9ACTN|nr:integrase [Micromonospora radicis]